MLHSDPRYFELPSFARKEKLQELEDPSIWQRLWFNVRGKPTELPTAINTPTGAAPGLSGQGDRFSTPDLPPAVFNPRFSYQTYDTRASRVSRPLSEKIDFAAFYAKMFPDIYENDLPVLPTYSSAKSAERPSPSLDVSAMTISESEEYSTYMSTVPISSPAESEFNGVTMTEPSMQLSNATYASKCQWQEDVEDCQSWEDTSDQDDEEVRPRHIEEEEEDEEEIRVGREILEREARRLGFAQARDSRLVCSHEEPDAYSTFVPIRLGTSVYFTK